MNCDGAEDVSLAINSSKNVNTSYDPVNSLAFHAGVLCAKASMLIQVMFIISSVVDETSVDILL